MKESILTKSSRNKMVSLTRFNRIKHLILKLRKMSAIKISLLMAIATVIVTVFWAKGNKEK